LMDLLLGTPPMGFSAMIYLVTNKEII